MRTKALHIDLLYLCNKSLLYFTKTETLQINMSIKAELI